jgi:sec-independent protein translocase protein TatA
MASQFHWRCFQVLGRGVSMIGKLGMPEILLILFMVLLLFGPKKLGELGKGLGEGIRSFKAGISGNDLEAKNLEAKKK